MRVYHASYCVVECPGTAHSRSSLDFGRGFYVTALQDQALEYGQRFIRRGRRAYLCEYELDEEALAGFDVMRFATYDHDWLTFVMGCRNGDDASDWDVIIGGVEDDRVFTTVDLYFAGEITEEEALGRLVYVKPNDQLCLRSQRAIDGLLRFCGAREIL